MTEITDVIDRFADRYLAHRQHNQYMEMMTVNVAVMDYVMSMTKVQEERNALMQRYFDKRVEQK